jgi:putative ABC transport system permease protein
MYEVRTLQEVVGRSVARQRFTAWIVGIFALLAFAIAAVGVYGVVSYSVSNRTREIGIRIALGATRRRIVGLVLGETFTLLVMGLTGGLILAFAAGGALRSLLFETAPTDPLTYTLAVVLLATVGLTASYVPTRRALGVDPMTALRYE